MVISCPQHTLRIITVQEALSGAMHGVRVLRPLEMKQVKNIIQNFIVIVNGKLGWFIFFQNMSECDVLYNKIQREGKLDYTYDLLI